MKKICICLFICLILSSNILAAEQTFNDIDGHWAETVIEKWKDNGYINGYPDGSFKPDNPVTRAELSKILSLAFNLSETENIIYEDVSDNSWYYAYLERSAKYIPVYALPTLYESNIPYSENQLKNKFLPDVNAIRMHVAEALVEIELDRENIDVEELSVQEMNAQIQEVFKDADYQSLDAIPHSGIPKNVQRMKRYTWLAYKMDIMEGNEEGYFEPYGYITRAELITAIDRIIE